MCDEIKREGHWRFWAIVIPGSMVMICLVAVSNGFVGALLCGLLTAWATWFDARGIERNFKLRQEAEAAARSAEDRMIIRCSVCMGDQFLEGPSGGLCTNYRCAKCGTKYNVGPGMMERI